MGRKVVPVKTKEGTQEIRARALGLAPRIRTALLLVDGVKSMDELERLMDAAGVTPGALQMLLDKGLVRIPEPEPEPQPVQPVALPPVTVTNAAHTILQRDGKPANDLPLIAPTVLEPRFEPTLYEPQKERIDVPRSRVAVPEPPTEVRPPQAPRVLNAPLEVVTLLELETILGAATKMEVATILGVATMLELTPTQMRAPNTAVKAPPLEAARLTPLSRAERDLHALREDPEPRPVIPAHILLSNLMAARAHLAAALDEFLEIDGYLLKQKVMACENRAELEALVPQLAAAFIKKIEKTAAKRLLSTAEAMLDR
jgi:hypothetical protein